MPMKLANTPSATSALERALPREPHDVDEVGLEIDRILARSSDPDSS